MIIGEPCGPENRVTHKNHADHSDLNICAFVLADKRQTEAAKSMNKSNRHAKENYKSFFIKKKV